MYFYLILQKKNESDNFFILEVSEHSQIIRAILCRGTSYPVITPKPMVSELPLKLPVCTLEAEKSLLEESLIRYANTQADNATNLMKEMAFKLFAVGHILAMEYSFYFVFFFCVLAILPL